MLLPESGVRLWLYAPPTDMRKSFDGLSALARQKLVEDPTSGRLFVFINRRRTQLKVLYFEQGGHCLWSKRLEAGRFHFDAQGGDKQVLSWTELKLIIKGIDLRSVREVEQLTPCLWKTHFAANPLRSDLDHTR